MKTAIPFLLVLSACAADPALRDEVAALRAEVREATAPKLEALDAWTELTKEVKRLREELAVPPPPAPRPLAAQALPLRPVGKAGEVTGAVGSATPGLMDLYWVLAKVTVENEERTVLALYQAGSGNRSLKLVGVRVLSYDLQVVEYANDRPHVKDIIEELKKLKPK